jgi:CheY-like chemotaxis protein
MAEKILLVDDEPSVLSGYQRLLHTAFESDTALGAAAALSAIESKGPFAVVVSDYQMPQMNGIQLLARIKASAPDTIRILLTGNADIQTAVGAVNEGNIFRFLTKPCTRELLTQTLNNALAQYRLLIAEKELLEKTLHGSIHVLTEVLSLVNPAAFSRSTRLRRYIAHIAKKLALENSWKFEVAAMMSQLGCVTIDPETIEAVYTGQKLSAAQQKHYDTHPMVASDLLKSIPRMESIAWIIAHQNQPTSVNGDISDREMTDRQLGADLLRIALAFDELLLDGSSRAEAAHHLSRQFTDVDKRIFEALVELEPEPHEKKLHTCAIRELTPGMILDAEIRTYNGQLVAAKRQEVTAPLILKLKSFRDRGTIEDRVVVSSPKAAGAASHG